MTQGLYNVCSCDDVGTASQILQNLYFTLDFLLLYWLENFNSTFFIIYDVESVDLLQPSVPTRWHHLDFRIPPCVTDSSSQFTRGTCISASVQTLALRGVGPDMSDKLVDIVGLDVGRCGSHCVQRQLGV